MKIDVLGVGFDNLTMDEAVSRGMEIIKERGGYAVTPNPEIVWMCRNDASVAQAVNGASVVLPDGIGVIYGARILGTPLKEKVPGIDFAARIFKELAAVEGSVYLFGSKPGVAEAAADKIARDYPGLRIVGTHDGYFSDDRPIIEDINAAAPDLLLVCLGAPKQELWMAEHAGKLNCGLMAGLGGSLDVFSGAVERAPERWQKANLEWLYRLGKEPRRIGRMLKLPVFLLAVVGSRIRGK